MLGLGVAGAAFAARSAIQQYIRWSAMPVARSFYRVREAFCFLFWWLVLCARARALSHRRRRRPPPPAATNTPPPHSLPHTHTHHTQKQQRRNPPHTHTPTNQPIKKGGFLPEMTRREAAQILGVRERAGEERVKDAHRRIMIANHPDSGE